MSDFKVFSISAREDQIDDLMTFLEEAELNERDFNYTGEEFDRIYTNVNEIALEISDSLQR